MNRQPPVYLHLTSRKLGDGASQAINSSGSPAKPLPLPAPGLHRQGVDPQVLAHSAVQKAAAHAGGGAPLAAPLTESQTAAVKKIEQFAKSLKVADQAGVQLARATFMSKLLGVGVCTVAVVVATALTGASFGVGAAFLAVASVRLAVAVGDAACAYKAYTELCETPPRKTLPLGANSLGNFLYMTAFRNEKDSDQRVRKATLAAGAVSLALAIAGTALSLGAAAPDAVGQGLRLGCGALLALMWGRDSHVADSADAASASMRQARREALHAIKKAVTVPGGGELHQQFAALEAVVQQTPEFNAYKEQVTQLLDAKNLSRIDSLAPVVNRAFANTTRDMTSATLLSGQGVGLLLKVVKSLA